MAKEKTLSDKERGDIRTLLRFIGIYCRENHGGEKKPFSSKNLDEREIGGTELPLCEACSKLLNYGLTMRMKCPHDPKPMCKKCGTPCYHDAYRSKIREVMRFSGIFLIKRGRVDMLYHYLR
jgi:hypothetical protein